MKKSSFNIDLSMQLSGFKTERLMQLSIPTIRTDVNMPDNSGYILTRSDARSHSISGMLVQVDLLTIINSNLLIIRIFCQYFVDKKFEPIMNKNFVFKLKNLEGNNIPAYSKGINFFTIKKRIYLLKNEISVPLVLHFKWFDHMCRDNSSNQ